MKFKCSRVVVHLNFVYSKEKALGTVYLVPVPVMNSGLKEHI